MSKQFPYPCVRCGFCCLCTPCNVALKIIPNAKQFESCPALSINNKVATCKLIETAVQEHLPKLKEIMGFGLGCCMKARAFKNGIEYDFAAMPEEWKTIACIQKLKQNLQKENKKMTIVTKCNAEGCPIKNKCFRFTAPDDGFQSYLFTPPYNHQTNTCEEYTECIIVASKRICKDAMEDK
jgi:hypothetical protein